METEDRLESALEAAQGGSETALKAASSLTAQLRKARGAAVTGQVRELRKALDSAVALAADLTASVRAVRTSFDIDEVAYLASGGFAKELLATAAEQGILMFEQDERLLCYPSIVKIIPGDVAAEIDKRRERRLRPSVLVAMLAGAQQRPPKFRPEPFLEALADGYDLVIARASKKPDAVVRLVDIWSVLTLLPGQGKEYTRPEFARDLYLLDQKAVRQTRNGRTLRWHASSGTRTAGVLTTVARTGQQQLYWGVSFGMAMPR